MCMGTLLTHRAITDKIQGQLSGYTRLFNADSGEEATAEHSLEVSLVYFIVDFPVEQSHDEILGSAFDQVMKIGGHMACSDPALSYPLFVLIKDRLHQICRDTCKKAEYTQLLVPKICQKMIFQAAHHNPTAVM